MCIRDSEQAADSLKEVEKRLTDMTLLIKNINTYQKTKPVYACLLYTSDVYKRQSYISKIVLLILPLPSLCRCLTR